MTTDDPLSRSNPYRRSKPSMVTVPRDTEEAGGQSGHIQALRSSVVLARSPTVKNLDQGNLQEQSTLEVEAKQGHSLSWEKLNVKINHEGKDKVLLKNLTGQTYPTQITAVMGSSGAGKTTLLKAFTGRGAYEGTICLDHEPVDTNSLEVQRKIAFVESKETVRLPSAVLAHVLRQHSQ